MAKCTFFRPSSAGNATRIRGVGASQTFAIGTPCSNEFGGGKIGSIEIDRALQALVIRKESGTFRANQASASGVREEFDAVCVPLASLKEFTIVEEKQPQQQQGGQQKR